MHATIYRWSSHEHALLKELRDGWLEEIEYVKTAPLEELRFFSEEPVPVPKGSMGFDDILEATERASGRTRAELFSRRQERELVHWRWCCMYICTNELAHLSHSVIARLMHRDITMVSRALYSFRQRKEELWPMVQKIYAELEKR